MPKRKTTSFLEFEQLLLQPGHRWKNRVHMFSVFVLGGIFGSNFNSMRNAIVFAMYMSNWLEISPEKPHKSLTIKNITDTLDKYLHDKADQKEVYKFFGTSPNTFKEKYSTYIKIPNNPTLGQMFLAMNNWTDKKWQILRPIKIKEIAELPCLYHKKISLQIQETPMLKEFLKNTNQSFTDLRAFPPIIIENYFEEIGEPERYKELVDLILEKEY